MASVLQQLDAADRTDIEAGRHFDVAARLVADGRHALAGWVFEQIWAFVEATSAYLTAERYVDALRTASESGDGSLFDRAVDEALSRAPADQRAAAAELLLRRGRHLESSRFTASLDDVPQPQAEALAAAGDRYSAAELLFDAGDAPAALDLLRVSSSTRSPRERALAARIAWELGDTENAARHAQAALREGIDGDEVRRVSSLLGRALSTLGYDLAAQLALGDDASESDDEPTARGRYLVTASLPTQYAGATYVGVDRVTLNEVEIHLLLKACSPEEARQPVLIDAVDRFFQAATAASDLAHPAIRTVLRTDLDQALLVLPRAAGPTLHHLLHPPRPPQSPVRAKNLIAFLLQGLAHGHARGLVHGQILPVHIVSDALGRPLLGPFGAHHLAGLTATQTAGLAEVVAFTAPERRRGGEPTAAADIFAVGMLLRALLAGSLAEPWPPSTIDRDDVALVAAMTATDPQRRPAAAEALERLALAVTVVTELYDRVGATAPPEPDMRRASAGPLSALTINVHHRFTTDQLDVLAGARCPWLQTILDRDDRRLHLAAWSEGCRRLGPDAPWRELAAEVLAAVPEGVREVIEPYLDHEAFVVTPAGDCMVALDSLLAATLPSYPRTSG